MERTLIQTYSKADTHLHSTCSDGLATPEEMVEYIAEETDLRVISVTDHDTVEGAYAARAHVERLGLDIDVIIGQEVTTDEGDIIGLFVHKTMAKFHTAQDAIDAIHAQGGLAIAVHPFSYWPTFRQMLGVGRRITSLPLDGVEVRNGFPTNWLSNWYTAYLNRRGPCLSELGGSDSHVPYTVGQAHTLFAGTCAQELRIAIETGRTIAAGSMWRASNLARTALMILRHGYPSMEDKHPRSYEIERRLRR